jgi:Rrf2 family protein
MFNFSRKTDYALLALARLAEEGQRGSPMVSARGIAATEGLPLPLLMNLLKELGRAGLVQSSRGMHGGYSLGRPAEAIRVGDVIRAIEGPVEVALCCRVEEGTGSAAGARIAGGTGANGNGQGANGGNGSTRATAATAAEPATPAPAILDHATCHLVFSCRIGANIRRLNERMRRFLDEVTLRDLIGPAEVAQTPPRYTAIGA